MRRWTRNWMIRYAAVLHLIWGAVLLFSAAPLSSTPLADFAVLHHSVVGVLMIAVALMAMTASRTRSRLWGSALATPQQFFLLVSAFTSASAVINGHYADGTVVPRLHIFVDQLPSMLAMVMHTFALLDWFAMSYGETVEKQHA